MIGFDNDSPPQHDVLIEQHPAPPAPGRHRLRSLGRALVQVVLPETCAGCGVSGTWFCVDCASRARRIDQAMACPRCGRPGTADRRVCRSCVPANDGLTACRSVFEHDGPVREAVHRLKYGGEYARAEWCADEMTMLLHATGWDSDILVPVPLHPQRLRQRGYNQSERITRHMAGLTGIPEDGLLLRTRFIRPQVGLNMNDRRANVAGAFAANRAAAGASILLIDDVVTTGSTLHECARALRAAGAADVRALTLAREVS